MRFDSAEVRPGDAVRDRLADLKARAARAVDRPAAFGPDVDLSRWVRPGAKRVVDSPQDIAPEAVAAAAAAGVVTGGERSGTYFQVDHSVVYRQVEEAFRGKLEIMTTTEALRRYSWLQNYWWRLVKVDLDKYTAHAHLFQNHGYFIRVYAGQEIEAPIQACLLVAEKDVHQRVHNIVIMEEGSKASLVTGCTLTPGVASGTHLGISEFYLGKGASLSFTMVHNWAEEFHVRPRTGALLEDGAEFTSNYVLLKPVKSLQMYPRTVLAGRDSRARFSSLIQVGGDAVVDVGSEMVLEGSGARGEAVSRAIAFGAGRVCMRGRILGRHNETKGHLDCRGILFSARARIEAIPELDVEGAPGADLSHEAAIGPIAEEAVEYLMARGVAREEAVSLIIRGFMESGLPPLPKPLADAIENAARIIRSHPE